MFATPPDTETARGSTTLTFPTSPGICSCPQGEQEPQLPFRKRKMVQNTSSIPEGSQSKVRALATLQECAPSRADTRQAQVATQGRKVTEWEASAWFPKLESGLYIRTHAVGPAANPQGPQR